MINTFIALLVEFKMLSKEEGEALADKIAGATLPGDFSSAHRQVREFLDDVKKGR